MVKKITQVSESLPFDNSSNGFLADNAQTAIEEAKQNAEGFPRAGCRSIYNGTLSNGQWMGPSELTSNTPLLVFPVKTKINEITWANQNTNVSFDINFYKNQKGGITPFYTLSVRNGITHGYVSGLSYTFDPGDILWAQYIDYGTNLSDADLILWISRIP